MATMSVWSSAINSDKELREITMPGSHDAGIYTGDARKTGITRPGLSSSICQTGSIFQQCMDGSRFFDIRLKQQGGAIKAFHQFAGQGAVGGTDATILDDVDRFLKAHASEFVILRISHTKDRTNIRQTIAASNLGARLYKGAGNIATTRIGDLRGKAICIFDTADFPNLVQSDGFHPFSKFSGGAGAILGVQTCGKYADDKSICNVISSQVKHASEHEAHPKDHLFVMYWTQTGGNIRKHTEKAVDAAKAFRKKRATGGTHHNMDYLSQLLHTGAAKYGEKWKVMPTTWQDRRDHMPNVIMYDFVNATTSSQIVALNDPGLVGILVD